MSDQYKDVGRLALFIPANALAINYVRGGALGNTGAYLNSGLQSFSLMYLDEGTLVSAIWAGSGTTAAVGPTNQWVSLYDQYLNRLSVSEDRLTEAWGASTAKTFAFPTPFRTTYSGLYYIGTMVAAGTVPTIQGNTFSTIVSGLVPNTAFRDTANAGLTTPATAPLVATNSITIGALMAHAVL